ncbi:hypothetical protein ACX27_26790 [Nostoc piscinale CENA21]|uniref:Uncharacterized protein n=1 Tax=Nostoc piscinale CENA21 TaxID=224013 RepID=A0A0M4TP41_9NOSO|nr:hypothetical protein [Nostoc piscinale]ALF55636.1 hypothetical protein ACX27_26790 [Nostoc piscinale CENA21]
MAGQNISLDEAIQELINIYKPMLEANYKNYYYHVVELKYRENVIWVNGRPYINLSEIIEAKAQILADDYKIDRAHISHWISSIREASKDGTLNDVLFIFMRLRDYLPKF